MPRLFLCNLGGHYREDDVSDLFYKYGKITKLTLKGTYGFVDLDNEYDCEDAIRSLNGKSFHGSRLIVQWSNRSDNTNNNNNRKVSESRSESGHEAGHGPGHGHRPSSSGHHHHQHQRKRCSDGKFKVSNWRVIVSGLAPSTTWKRLKEYMMPAGVVIYATVEREREGEGLVEFRDKFGMMRAIDELNGGLLDGNRIRMQRERLERSRSRSFDRYETDFSRSRSLSRESCNSRIRRSGYVSRQKRSFTRSFSREKRSFSISRSLSRQKSSFTRSLSRPRKVEIVKVAASQNGDKISTRSGRASRSVSKSAKCLKRYRSGSGHGPSRSLSRPGSVIRPGSRSPVRKRSKSRSRTSASSWTWSRY